MENTFTENDWIQLKWKDANGEYFKGFLSADGDGTLSYSTGSIFAPFLTVEDLIGGVRPSRIMLDSAIKMPLDIQEVDIKAMIELALVTNDREWFEELTSKLSKIKIK